MRNAQHIITEAEQWQRHGMEQASFSWLIYSWTGVRILTSDWTRYPDVFVIAIAVFYRLPNLPKDSHEYAEAAFKLCDKLDGVDDVVDKDNKEKAKGATPMPWDAPNLSLLPHLLDYWNNTRTVLSCVSPSPSLRPRSGSLLGLSFRPTRSPKSCIAIPHLELEDQISFNPMRETRSQAGSREVTDLVGASPSSRQGFPRSPLPSLPKWPPGFTLPLDSFAEMYRVPRRSWTSPLVS